MAKRKAEIDDDVEQRAVFIDTSLDTHLVLLVSPTDSFSLLKQKFLVEHPKCFPDFGVIKINALKVKRRGCYYHLLDSMLVKTAFYGVTKNWFLLADVSSEIACYQTPSNIISIGPSKALPLLVGSSKHLESRIEPNADDHYGSHSSDVNKMSGLEMPNNFDLLGAHIESKLVEETLNSGDPRDSSDKKNKKKRKRAEPDDSGDENGEKLDDLHINHVEKEPTSRENAVKNVENDTKLTNNVTDDASPSAHAKKKPKVATEDAQETSLSKSNSFISDSNRVNAESGAVVGTNDQGDMQRSGSVDVSGLASSETSTDIRKRKKEKGHASSELPSSEVNEKENLAHIDDHVHNASASTADTVAKLESLPVHRASVQSSGLLLEDGNNSLAKDVDYQEKGTSTSLDKLVNDEIESDKIGLAPEPRAKNTKKAKKGDVNGVDASNCPSEMPNTPKNGCAPTQNENTIHGRENSVPGSMELGSRGQKKKVKKGEVSTKEKTDLSSMETNKDVATYILSNGHVENDNNFDIADKSHKGDTIRDDKKREPKVKASSISSQDGDQEADDTKKIGEEQMHASEIKEPEVNAKIRGEKAKRKTQKKQTLSVKDTSEISVKEQPGEKTTETDVPRTANVNPSGNDDVDGSKNVTGDLQDDINKTPPMEVAIDVTEVGKTDRPHSSKRKVKRHDLPSSIDTSCGGHNMLTSKKNRGSGRTSRDGTRLKDDEEDAECMRHISTEPVHPLPINKDEDKMEITRDKPKKRTEKRHTALKDPPKSPVEQQLDEKTTEMAVPNSADGDLLANAAVNDANHRGGLSLREHHSENLDDSHPSDSAGFVEVSNQDKIHSSKEDVKKLDLPSSMDTSSNQPSRSKSKKSKESKRKCQNVTQPQESIAEQHQDIPLTQPSGKRQNAAVIDANHRGGLSRREHHSENLDDIHPSDSTGLVEVSNQDKSHASKEDVKKLDLPSSMDTSSNQPSRSKSKKSKESKRTPQNVTQPQESITEQPQDIPLTQPSGKHCGTFKEGIEPQALHADPDNSAAKVALNNRSTGARKSGFASAGLHDGSKLPEPSTVYSPVSKSLRGKKTKEPQNKLDGNHMGSKRSLKNMGEVVNGSPQKKGLLVTPGAIFEDGSSSSSDEEDKMEGSGSSTRTPSDNLSSSDYSEGESKGDVVTSRHDASKGGDQDGTNPSSSGFKNMPLHSILRSSSRYKKAKVVASQSQLEDSEPVDFVPDSQGNL